MCSQNLAKLEELGLCENKQVPKMNIYEKKPRLLSQVFQLKLNDELNLGARLILPTEL